MYGAGGVDIMNKSKESEFSYNSLLNRIIGKKHLHLLMVDQKFTSKKCSNCFEKKIIVIAI